MTHGKCFLRIVVYVKFLKIVQIHTVESFFRGPNRNQFLRNMPARLHAAYTLPSRLTSSNVLLWPSVFAAKNSQSKTLPDINLFRLVQPSPLKFAPRLSLYVCLLFNKIVSLVRGAAAGAVRR